MRENEYLEISHKYTAIIKKVMERFTKYLYKKYTVKDSKKPTEIQGKHKSGSLLCTKSVGKWLGNTWTKRIKKLLVFSPFCNSVCEDLLISILNYQKITLDKEI
ncbi:hypothetical protein GDO86_000241 [Hymenochirus boettgeri]|uniref:Uncharacterized protein n=1 Tax=Hymenochirus boettgeri TaxID=247094 RepID=A0A8T2K7Q2_9PIPI|nr:hypothetical protein GDO86_000241 [Hymenochirus boettgeri]